jgi:hypothetical protein
MFRLRQSEEAVKRVEEIRGKLLELRQIGPRQALDEFSTMHNNAAMNASPAIITTNLNLVRSRGAPG